MLALVGPSFCRLLYVKFIRGPNVVHSANLNAILRILLDRPAIIRNTSVIFTHSNASLRQCCRKQFDVSMYLRNNQRLSARLYYVIFARLTPFPSGEVAFLFTELFWGDLVPSVEWYNNEIIQLG